MAMTLTDLLTQCRVYLQDPTASRWSDAELTQWLNEAQDDFGDRTKCNRTTAALSLAASTPTGAFYTLPADLLSLDRVTRNGYELARTNIDSLAFEGWETQTGTAYWFIHGPYGFGTLRVYPYTTAAQPLTAYYAKQLTRLTLGTDTPALIPVPYHIALVYYALGKAYDKDFEYRDLTKAQSHSGQYGDYVTRCVGNLPTDPIVVPFRYL